MDLPGAGVAQHGDDGPDGGRAHDGVVHHHQALAGDVVAQRIQLAPHAVDPGLLVRGDEGAADVAVLDQALAVGDAAGPGVALGRRHARVGHPHHQVRLDRGLGGQQLAHPPAGPVDLAAVEAAVGPGEVDELEDAQVRPDPLGREQLLGVDPVLVDHHQLARLELADEGGPDHVEGRRLGGQHPALGAVDRPQAAEAQGPQALGVAHPVEVGGVEQDEAEGALDVGEHRPQRRTQVVVGAVVVVVGAVAVVVGMVMGHQLGHHVAVGGHHAREHPGPVGQLGRVGQVAVVAEGEAGPPHRPVDGLGGGPLRRTVGGVPGVADGQVPGQAGQGPLVEHRGDQSHVLDHGDGLAVAHRHAGRLLAAVLQGVDAVEGQLGRALPGRVHPEDPAGFLHRPALCLAALGSGHPARGRAPTGIPWSLTAILPQAPPS